MRRYVNFDDDGIAQSDRSLVQHERVTPVHP